MRNEKKKSILKKVKKKIEGTSIQQRKKKLGKLISKRLVQFNVHYDLYT